MKEERRGSECIVSLLVCLIFFKFKDGHCFIGGYCYSDNEMAPFGCRACQSSKALNDWTDFNPCQNGGNCVDKTIGYYCMCPPGYRGFNCEYDINECASDPCQNGGTCIDLVANFKCDCVTGYEGETCSIDLNKCLNNPCENGGRCEDQINRRTCHCADGFEGTNCEKDDPTLMIVVFVCSVLVLVIIVVASTNRCLNAIHKGRKLRKIDGNLSLRYEGNEEVKNPKNTAFYKRSFIN